MNGALGPWSTKVPGCWVSITELRRPARVERRRGRCCPGRRESHPRLDVVPPHAPALVGHWESCSDAALCRTLLSYGTRWRAASPMRAKNFNQEESARVELAT